MFITREDEHNLPDFTSHDEAKAYFKIDMVINFILNIPWILRVENYIFHQLCCTQNIQIFEDGEIHIVY